MSALSAKTKGSPFRHVYLNIIEARGIKGVERNGMSDPYVTVSSVGVTKPVVFGKTHKIRNTVNPKWNHDMMLYLDEPSMSLITGINMVLKDWNAVTSDTTLGTAYLEIHSLLITGRYYELPIYGGGQHGTLLVYAAAIRLPKPTSIGDDIFEELPAFRLLLGSEGMHANGAMMGTLFFHAKKPTQIHSLGVGLELEFNSHSKPAHIKRWGVDIIGLTNATTLEPGLHFWPFSFVTRDTLLRSHPPVVNAKVLGSAHWTVLGKKKSEPERGSMTRTVKWYHKDRGFDQKMKYDLSANAYPEAPNEEFQVAYHHILASDDTSTLVGNPILEEIRDQAQKLEDTIDEAEGTGKTFTFKTEDESTGLPIGAPKYDAKAIGGLNDTNRWLLQLVWRHKRPVSCEHFQSDYLLTVDEFKQLTLLKGLHPWGASYIYPTVSWEEVIEYIWKN